jgi:hypothetical protein
MAVRSLYTHIGKDVIVFLTGVAGAYRAKLELVEDNGIWLESEELLQTLLAASELELTTVSKTVFLTFPQVRFIVTNVAPVTSRDKRFGWRRVNLK